MHSAAIYGLRNKADVSIFILHPKGRVSPIQEAQMTTITDENVYNLAVQGTFDDCQDIVKALFSDASFNAAYHLGAVNSINWARILAQTVYYFHAFFQLQRASPGVKDLQFVVPTGNFGDILAGYYARRMGLPMGSCKLGVATNANDILARFWKTGRYEKEASVGEYLPAELAPSQGASDGKQGGGVKETMSPAMDILVSSNFERLLWYLAYEDTDHDRLKAGEVLNGWMNSMKTNGRVQVPTTVLESARWDFCAERVDDNEVRFSARQILLSLMLLQTLVSIRSHFTASPSYVVDPHTAVGLVAAERMAPHKYVLPSFHFILSHAHMLRQPLWSCASDSIYGAFSQVFRSRVKSTSRLF